MTALEAARSAELAVFCRTWLQAGHSQVLQDRDTAEEERLPAAVDASLRFERKIASWEISQAHEYFAAAQAAARQLDNT